ncbi:Exosome complex exonuclease RRP44 [Eumeta japonica]|uniref:Protein DIS3 homolog n=1 Tax=Eumeta variegata TaxID=151549 RepID=A0A4C1VJ73_EUMVA|nr:Exosome complex exonuclease RRP44 [Eumeta japonica]
MTVERPIEAIEALPKDTYVERLPGEKQNDRNDRAIRKAVAWYSSHLSIENRANDFPQIVLLTDDENNRKLAQEEGIICCSVKDYIENVNGFVGLVDKLSKNIAPESCSKDALYPAYLTPSQIHAGIRAGKLYQGTFRASRDNFMEAFAVVSGYEKPILLQGHIGINRAVDGDVVAVEIFPPEEWRKPSDIVLEDKTDDPGDLLEEETVLLSNKPLDSSDDDITPTGKIVGIIRRKWRQYCGILQPSKLAGAVRHLFVPAEKRIPRVRIETRQSDILAFQRILVALDSWPRNSRYPLGHFVRALGPIGNKAAENEVLLLEHDIPHARFSEAVLSCLPLSDWIIPQKEINKRVDLRSICICSVDPPGCTDIDDALHASPLLDKTKDGLKKFEVGVHIADVTYFVRPNTALDKEAALRSTTVYLVDKRIDMVPDLLSSNLCSLRGGEERLAFSCIWQIDENANVISTKFHKSVIKSRAAMTYEEAQIAIDTEYRNDEIASSLRILNMLAKKLKKKRLDNGALVLASPEIRFQVDSETHDPIEVQTKAVRDTNSMVEEFMLLANVSVAQHLAVEFPQCALLRRHPSPPPDYFTTFLKAAKQQGFELDASTNASLSKSLDAAVIPDRPYFNTLLRIMATRCMQQAVYFSSGTKSQEEFYHYGLACPIYTHFTSPIRRYADVIVHRLLAATIGADSTYAELLDSKTTDSLCENLNYRHRQAQYAARASVALNTHILFKNRVEIESAVVLAVKRNALQVLIPKYGLEGPLYLPAEKFIYNEEEHFQICGDVILKTFDELIIRLSLDSSNLQHRKLVFQLVKPYIPDFSYNLDEDEKSDVIQMDVELIEVKAEEPSGSVAQIKRKDNTQTKSRKKRSKKK